MTAINSAVAVLLGYPLPRVLEPRLGARGSLVLGVAGTGLGILAIGVAPNVAALLAAVLLFSLGTTLVRPNEQTVAAAMADRRALGSYFGVAALAVAVGGGLGNVAGGSLYDLGGRLGLPALPWVVCAAVGFASAAGLRLSMGERGVARDGSAVMPR